MLAALKIVAPGFEDFNNGQELSIVSFVSSFSKDYLPRKIGYRMLLTKIRFQIQIIWWCVGVEVQLIQYSTYSIAGCINLNTNINF